jgi:hypothetical protein
MRFYVLMMIGVLFLSWRLPEEKYPGGLFTSPLTARLDYQAHLENCGRIIFTPG